MLMLYLLYMIVCMPMLARIPIDRTAIVVYADKKTIMIPQSELDLPSLSGERETPRDKIFKYLVEDEAERFGMQVTPDIIQENWDKINLPEAEKHKLVQSVGYTVDEAKAELGRTHVSNQVLGFRVQSQIFVSKKEVLAYYNAHPEHRQAEFFIARALIPHAHGCTADEQLAQIQNYRATGSGLQPVWQQPFWLLDNEIAANRRFICSMNPGEIAEPMVVNGGFELIKLIDKRPACVVPLQERYNAIEYELKMPKFKHELDRYIESLAAKATVVHV